MYEELVNNLRGMSRYTAGTVTDLCKQAADAIEELSKVYETVNDAHNEGYDVDYWAGRRDYEPKWVSVTERLPEDHKMVIGFTPCDGYMFIGYHVTSFYYDRDFSYWNIITAMRSTKKMTKKVTHWMSLPESPKEER